MKKIIRLFGLSIVLFRALEVSGQVSVVISSAKIVGQRAIVPITVKSQLAEKIESVRAVCFLFDEHGKIAGQATKWVIGGNPGKAGLAPGATNTFNFVIAVQKPITTTNLTAKISITRLVLEGGRLADPQKDCQVGP